MTTATAPAVSATPPAARPAASAMRTFVALLHRDVRVARRELATFLVRTIMQPVLFLIVFGYLLPKMGFVRGDYTTALVPGVLAVSLTLSSVQSVALPMVTDFGFTREIEDRLLAPAPIQVVALAKIASGTLQGLLAAAVTLPVARLVVGPLPPVSWPYALAALGITLLGAAAFSAIGLLLGTVISPQQIGLMFSIVVAPMLMFGCAYYPWQGLAAVPAVQMAVLVNPLVYVAEGLRGTLTPASPHMPLGIAVSALAALLLLFGWLGLRSFMKRALG